MSEENAQEIRRHHHWIVIDILAVLCIGLIFTIWMVSWADRERHTDLLRKAGSVAQAANPDNIKRLLETGFDHNVSRYARYRKLLIEAQSVIKCKSIFILVRRNDGSVYRIIDTGCTEHEEIQEDNIPCKCTNYSKDVFEKGSHITRRYIPGSRDAVCTVFVPIRKTGISGIADSEEYASDDEVNAILGMDIDVPDWNSALFRNAIPPIFLTLIAVLAMCSLLLPHRKWRISAPLRRMREIHPAAVVITVGLALTALAAFGTHEYSTRQQTGSFRMLAASRISSIASSLDSIRDIELESLGQFYENCANVTPESFMNFSSFLLKNPNVYAWEWIPAVPDAARSQFEADVRKTGIKDFEIWQEDENGKRIPAHKRAIYYPVLLIVPYKGNENVEGFDTASDATRKKALEEAVGNRLPSGTDPVPTIQNIGRQKGIILLRPVFDRKNPEQLKGFAAAVVGMKTLLKSAAIDNSVLLELSMQNSNHRIELIATSWNDAANAPSYELAETFLAFAFGKTFIITAHAGKEFMHLNRTTTDKIVVLCGILLTLAFTILTVSTYRRREELEQLVASRTAELKESEKSYHEQFSKNSSVMLLFDPTDGKIIDANTAALNFYGYTMERMLDMNIKDISTRTDGEVYHSILSSMKEYGSHFMEQHRIADGSLRDVQMSASCTQFGGRYIIHLIIYDITERKKAERMLAQATSRLSLATEAGGVGIWDYDIINDILVWDAQMFHLYGIDQPDFKGTYEAWKSSLHPDDRQRCNDEIQMAIREEKDFNTEFRIIWPDGSIHNIRAQAIIQNNPFGTPSHMIGTNWDITAQKQAEEAIRKQSGLIKSLLDSIPDIIFFKDINGVYLGCNPSFAEFIGKSREEIIGKTDYDLLDKKTADFFRYNDKLMLAQQAPRHNEEWITYPDGRRKLIDTLKTPYWGPSGELIGVLGISRDITERKKMEADIKLQNDFYNIIAKVSERLIQADSAKIEYEINHALKALGLFTKVDRSYIFEIDNARNELSNTFEWCMDGISHEITNLQKIPLAKISRWQHKFTRNEYILISALDNLPKELEEEKAILGKQGVKSMLAVPMYYGSILTGIVGFDSVAEHKQWNEQVIIMLKIIADVFAGIIYKKKTEEALLKARDEADAANKTKSEFLANISHEIRTPMNAILGFSSLLSEITTDKKAAAYLESIKIAGKNLLHLINDILDLSKIESGLMKIEYEPIDPMVVFEEIRQIFKLAVSEKNIIFSIDIDKDLPKVLILDELRLRQVLLNLVGNAVKFTHEGSIHISAKKIYKNDQHSTIDLIISVSDTGIGIRKQDQNIIFESFRQQEGQSARKYGGTGLGLSISKKLTEMMNGEIRIESEVGKGSVFSIILRDVAVGSAASMRRDITVPDQSSIYFENKTVLVVDDIESNRRLMTDLLVSRGLNVLTAENGQDAVNITATYLPNLILMDIVMPVMDGHEAVRILKSDEKTKHIPVIVITASIEDQKHEEMIKNGVEGYLTKPVVPDTLMIELSRFLPLSDTALAKTPAPKNDHMVELADELARKTEFAMNLKTEIPQMLKCFEGAIQISRIKDAAQQLASTAEKYESAHLAELADALGNAASGYDFNKITEIGEKLKNLCKALS